MIIAIINSNHIDKITLSKEVVGNYQVKDSNHNVYGNVIPANGKWEFHASSNYYVVSNGTNINSISVEAYSYLELKNRDNGEITYIYIYPSLLDNETMLQIKKNKLLIGKNTSADIIYNGPQVMNNHAYLSYENNNWIIDCQEGYAFVNDRMVKKKKVNHGDIIFIYGLKIFCIANMVVVSNLVKSNSLNLNNESFSQAKIMPQEKKEGLMTIEGDKELYGANEQFLRSPRFRTTNKNVDIEITQPQTRQEQQITPTVLTIGPQMTMMITSFITMYSTISNVITGNGNMSTVMPRLIISIVTLVSSFLWPALTRRWNKKEQKRKEVIRVRKYRRYLENKEKEIIQVISEQKQVLVENNVSLEECQAIIYQKKRNLWEKTILDDDYLTVRIGTGFVKPNVNIAFKEEDFPIDDDMLKNELKDLIKKYSYLEETPLNTSLVENRITAIIGNSTLLKPFFESMLLQLMTFHIFSELKIVIISDENKIRDWDYIRFSPHCWDNQRSRRFICGTPDERKLISNYLENVIKEREEVIYGTGESKSNTANPDAYKNFNQYFLIIIDSIEAARNLESVNKILKMKDNLGFSVIIKNNRIANLPSECSTFINISEGESGLFKTDLSTDNQMKFKADFNRTVNVENCVQRLANIYVNIPKEKHELPKSVGFLDMYGIGNVEQFNSLDRWTNNNPVASLSVPVGIDQAGELFNMDIHEKAFGPHGLVAGTTGSGKSEWIITYILSLCVNFSPLEVQFVLIDYKGGGLAGSFVNQETGMRLPHLVGTITNLDKSEIRRSLASLEAESKRRQRMFNEAREKVNDSSMNIYKYQQYVRKGMLDEPLSHLFIISDEFAELKAQEPEFLDQLVSIARIGRSLGIHLILATQKPAGVVDEQMWSNSRFKVCLRVAEKADSKDMIKCDDAAYLKQTGAFYLQVGMNEFFALGQSAYAGAKYKPTNVIKKKIDTAVEILDRNGNVMNTIEEQIEDTAANMEVHGEELLNIILYVSEVAKSQNMVARRLWLDAIPEIIYVDNLKKKYGYQRTPFVINPVIGEYDNPYQQKQALLTLNLNKGNVYISGVSGSGKEQLLQAIIYSIITNYTPQEASIYIADFGAETLAMFEDSPHVGGIAYQNNVDKIENLVRYAKKEYKSRRKRYREFGGNYESYIKYSDSKDSVMIFIINSIETMRDMYSDTFDNLNTIFAECAKYGIIFVISSTEKSAIRGKYMDSFVTKLALQQSDDGYSDILGPKARGIKPKELKGRGLLEINDVIYEFQTASIYEEDKLRQAINKVNEQLNNAYKVRVNPLPMIPRTLNLNNMKLKKMDTSSICVGYRKETIEPYYMNLQNNFGTIIISAKKATLIDYCKVFYRELENMASEDKRVYLFDANNVFKAERYNNIKYVHSEEIANTFDNLLIYTRGELKKYNSLENKNDYVAPRRSLIVIHGYGALKAAVANNKKFEELDKVVEAARDLQLFDFVLTDLTGDLKEFYREKPVQKILMDSYGVLIGNTYEQQPFIDVNTRDIRIRDAVPDNMGYVVEQGKAYYSQMLQYTEVEEEEEE